MRSTSSVSVRSMHYFIALRYRGVETYFLVIFFSLMQANQFGNHNDPYPEGKIKSLFFSTS